MQQAQFQQYRPQNRPQYRPQSSRLRSLEHGPVEGELTPDFAPSTLGTPQGQSENV